MKEQIPKRHNGYHGISSSENGMSVKEGIGGSLHDQLVK